RKRAIVGETTSLNEARRREGGHAEGLLELRRYGRVGVLVVRLERHAEVEPEHGPLDLWERNAEATARALPEVEVSDVEARVAQVVKERRAELHGQNLNRRCSELEIHDGRVRPDERLGPVPAQAIGTAQRNQRIQVVQIAIEKES